MGLRDTAQTDLGMILEDQTTGFGWPITVTDPAGTSASLVGFSNDIAFQIDPETGMMVSARTASIALRIKLLTDNGLELPEGIADTAGKPWVVVFTDINGGSHTFKVSQSNPDRAIGIVTCNLEFYES